MCISLTLHIAHSLTVLLNMSCNIFLSDISTKILFAFFTSSMCIACVIHIIVLCLIILTISGASAYYELPHVRFPLPLFISSPVNPNILINTRLEHFTSRMLFLYGEKPTFLPYRFYMAVIIVFWGYNSV